MEPKIMESSAETNNSNKRKRQDDDAHNKTNEEVKNIETPLPTDDSHFVSPPIDWKTIESELSDLVGAEASNKVVSFLQKHSTATESTTPINDTGCFVKLPPCPDKDTRRKLHQWIRTRLDALAKADTADEPSVAGTSCSQSNVKIIRIWHRRFERQMPNYTKFDTHSGARRSNGNGSDNRQHRFLRFVLYKENMDTGAAISQLQRRTGGNRGKGKRGGPLRVGHAGMKDKRGITTQFVTVPASTPLQVLCSWNSRGNKEDEGAAGGGHTTSKGVGVMRVGNFQYVSEELKLGRLRGNRFDIVLRNIQNEGRAWPDVHQCLDTAARAFQRTGFVNYFGVQRFGKFQDTHKTGIAVLKGDYESAIDIIMKPKSGESETVIAARNEWQDRFAGEPSDRASAEKECAKRVLKRFGRYMSSEVAILQSLARAPLDYRRAFSSVSRTMRMMFVHALQSYLWNHVASHRIEKMGLDLVEGDLVLVNDNGISDKRVQIVTKEDVCAEKFTIEDVVLPLIGTNTKLPQNECATMFEELLEQDGLQMKQLNEVRSQEVDVTGDYRKLICRPNDVDFHIIKYEESLKPLLQTDLMTLSGLTIETNEEGEDDAKLLRAMHIGFTLPSSSYATIAIRELTKRPTSGDYQRNLNLGS